MKGAVLVALAATIGNFLQGWDNAMIAGAILYIKKEFELSTSMEGLVVAMSLIGATVITTCSGAISDSIGRRPLLILSALFYFVGSLVMLWSPNVYILLLARLLDGFGIGLAVTQIPVYISETAPPEIRGSLNTLPQLTGSGGMFLSYCLVFGMSLMASPSWRIMLSFLGIPSVIYLLFAFYYLPESPRWLVSKGRFSEAKKELMRLRGTYDVSGELALLIEGLSVGYKTTIADYMIEPSEEYSICCPQPADYIFEPSEEYNIRYPQPANYIIEPSEEYNIRYPQPANYILEPSEEYNIHYPRPAELDALRNQWGAFRDQGDKDGEDDEGEDFNDDLYARLTKSMLWSPLSHHGGVFEGGKDCVQGSGLVNNSSWKALLEPGVKRAFVVGIGIQMFQQFAGMNGVLYYTPQILEEAGVGVLLSDVGISSTSASFLICALMTFLTLPCIAIAMRLIDTSGRRSLLLATIPVLITSLVILVISCYVSMGNMIHALISTTCVIVYFCTFVMGYGPIPNILCSEIFPIGVRSVCVSICALLFWICNIIVNYTFPVMHTTIGLGGIFALYAVVCAISLVFVYLKVPETKGMPLEVISEFYYCVLN